MIIGTFWFTYEQKDSNDQEKRSWSAAWRAIRSHRMVHNGIYLARRVG
jgi:hypothetical protein